MVDTLIIARWIGLVWGNIVYKILLWTHDYCPQGFLSIWTLGCELPMFWRQDLKLHWRCFFQKERELDLDHAPWFLMIFDEQNHIQLGCVPWIIILPMDNPEFSIKEVVKKWKKIWMFIVFFQVATPLQKCLGFIMIWHKQWHGYLLVGSQVIQASSKIISNFHILQRNTILQVNIFPNYHGKRWGSSPFAQVWCRRRHGSRLFGPGGAESGGRAVGGVHGGIAVQRGRWVW